MFPSPAEVKFMRLLGAKVCTLPYTRSGEHGFPMVIVLSRGKILRRAGMKREARYGRYYIDFANDLNWMIEIDGTHWHMDVVADMDREIAINEMMRRNPYGWRMLRIKAPRLWNDSAGLKREVLSWLSQ